MLMFDNVASQFVEWKYYLEVSILQWRQVFFNE